MHIVALTQIRLRISTGRAYYNRKISKGQTHNEAMRGHALPDPWVPWSRAAGFSGHEDLALVLEPQGR